MPQTTTALLLALAAASTTMLGAAIALARRTWPPRAIGGMLVAAAVAMALLASFELLPSALESGAALPEALAWAVLGAVLVVALHLVGHRFDIGDSPLQRSAILIAVALALHNIPEGAAPFAATLVSVQTGVVTAVAVGLHNIPEGLAIAGVVVAGGGSRTRAVVLTGVATLGEVLGILLAASAAAAHTGTVAGGIVAVVAGIMLAVSALELLPSALALLRTPQAAPARA
jgi:ZIP family zinc transporter